MSGTARTLALVSTAGLIGCSLLIGVDGLTGGLPPDGADGGASDGSPKDSIADGGSLDSMVTADALPGCGAPHTFCDDFEHGGLGATWDLTRTNQGNVAFDTTHAVSPSRSLLVTADPSDASGSSYTVALLKNFSGGFSGIHCELQVLLDTATPPQTAAGFAINVTGSSTSYLLLWNIDQASLYEERGSTMAAHPIKLPLSGKWTRVGVELKLAADAGQGVLILWYDGIEVVSAPSIGLPDAISGVRFDLGLALGYAPLSNPWRINYDDAWCDIL